MSLGEAANAETRTNLALDMVGRASLALAVVYELSSPGAYAALHGKMMPYVLDSFRHDARAGPGPCAPEMVATALERVRGASDDVRSDVAAVRDRAGARSG